MTIVIFIDFQERTHLMKSFSASQFKAHALAIMKAVSETGEPVTVTKRGIPLVKVTPCAPLEGETREAGRLMGTIAFERDVVSPLIDKTKAREGR
jgi:prevent-host-death family protein